jgi:hypothetical protein
VLDTLGSVPRRIGDTARVTAHRDVAETSGVALTVAFCPAAPLLLPGVAGRAAEETAHLRSACLTAVRAALSGAPDRVVVVGAAPAGARYGEGDVGSLRSLGIDLRIPFAGRPADDGQQVVPLPHLLGAWLLDQVGSTAPRVGVAPDGLGGALGDSDGPVAVLAVGDGSARRTIKSPGWVDEAGEPFDAAVAEALAAGDAAALAALDPALGHRVLAEGTPTWRAVGAALTGREITARLHCAEAPYAVGYFVADWTAR